MYLSFHSPAFTTTSMLSGEGASSPGIPTTVLSFKPRRGAALSSITGLRDTLLFLNKHFQTVMHWQMTMTHFSCLHRTHSYHCACRQQSKASATKRNSSETKSEDSAIKSFSIAKYTVCPRCHCCMLHVLHYNTSGLQLVTFGQLPFVVFYGRPPDSWPTAIIFYCWCFYHTFFSPSNLGGLWADHHQTLPRVRWWL